MFVVLFILQFYRIENKICPSRSNFVSDRPGDRPLQYLIDKLKFDIHNHQEVFL